jgi:hypothetical protein
MSREVLVTRSTLVCVAVAAVFGVIAPGAQAKTLQVKGSERGAVIDAQGATTLFAALGSDQRGQYAARNSTTSAPAANGTVTFTSKFIDYYAAGTESGTLTGTATLQPDGSATLSGTGKITAGTGRYKHAKGTLKFTGIQRSDGRYTVTYTGTLTY